MMKTTIIGIMSVFTFALSAAAAAFEETQSDTNAIWSFHVSFDLAPNHLSAVFKERFFVSQHFFIFVKDGNIIASTGSYNPHLSKQFGPWKIFSFISTNDQHALFTNICKNPQCSTHLFNFAHDKPPLTMRHSEPPFAFGSGGRRSLTFDE